MKPIFIIVLMLFVSFLILNDAICLSEQTSPPELIEKPIFKSFTEKQKMKLLSGKVVFSYVQTEDSEKGVAGNGVAYVLIHYPLKESFEIFTAFDKQYLYLPHVIKSDVLKVEENKTIVFKELDFLFINIQYTHILTRQPDEHRVDFVTDPTGENSIKFNKGYFQFQKVDPTWSLFTFALEKVETGFKIPNFIKKFIVSKDLPGVTENVKKRIESGGAWHK